MKLLQRRLLINNRTNVFILFSSNLFFKKRVRNLFLLILFLFCYLSIFSQEKTHIAHSPPKFQKDLFGRSFLLKWDGAVEFTIDDSYSETMPDSNQLEIHMAETKSLIDKRKFFPAIRLLKGITLCERIAIKPKKNPSPAAQKLLNKLLSEMQDKTDELEILTEPYGCYAKNKKGERKLFIESKDFSYLYEIDERFIYVFPTELYRFARKEKEYNWKVSYFRILLPDAKKEESFETEYFRYENEILYEPPSRIMLSIGQTYHKHSQDSSNYPFLWDARRGLSEAVKRGSNFIRREYQKTQYETTFQLSGQYQNRSYFGLEKYRFRNNKGLGIFLTCPAEFKEECSKIWKESDLYK